ncbi:topoisomerase subunit TopoM [Mycolicibacterium chitae]|uniref:DNA gyrase/topoisomerase IV subunit A n=1 Tax=Mycolicibacterium chitae TaxID=1792 RepID=A0A3S4RWV9_MYCCI|nr:DNA gyrase subunit A [Mycolicibacterium chitae]MCV7104742.1 topoisomerase IV [Mycolicibacterium chitae]BBZ01949.1 topoisomerase subunit TopoM [Mycolicibacterium chitae]VEG50775.1 DNA gyrase/topoisomerase IV subunit A [Mycolicibacterium chitae]
MTATLDIPEQNPDLVLDQSADDYWNQYQLTFALYSVSDRAIPSAYDGLKPGQRRLLYQMHDSRLLPGNKPQKSSKVCSAVTGNLHPHGGASMYGAAALMAADFQRVKVIDGQGAFPRIQGDIPAADRYTEMRLSAPGAALTAELDSHAVPMVPTFDGEWTEPTWLPAQWPVLLCNGAVGIAEGWATRVPAHNPREVMAACRALLKTPNMTDDRLVKLIPGPDWGCGASVVGTAGLREYITTGRGHFTVRGKVTVEGKNCIITELPPGVASSTVQDRIRSMVESGDLSGVADMSDLTDRRNGLRIVVTAKRGHDAEKIREQLLALTPLESTFAASLVALDENRVPRWWSVRELISAFLHLRDSVVLHRSEYRLEKVTARRHLVSGLMTIHLDIDAAVAVIRGSETVDDARQGLQKRFKIDELQADYVLGLQLRRLTKLDVIELQAEAEKLDAEFAELTELVTNLDARRKVIDKELVETAKLFKGPEFDRRTVLDFEATPVTANTDEDGPRERKVNTAWRLDDRGVFSDSHGELLTSGLGWAVWTDGRIKFTTGSGLPYKIRDIPVAPDITGLLGSGVLPLGYHLALVTRRGKVLRIDPAAVNPQGVAGNGVAGVKLAAQDPEDEVIAALPVSCGNGEAILSVSEKSWKVTEVADIPVKGRGGAGVGFHPFVKGEAALVTAAISATGYVRGKRSVRAENRAKAAIKGSGSDVTPAE